MRRQPPMTDEEFEKLERLLKAERDRGLARHWSYELARHRNLFNQWRIERERRDIEAIDAAFERAGRRMEAAE